MQLVRSRGDQLCQTAITHETVTPSDHEGPCYSNNCNLSMQASGDDLRDKFPHNSRSIDQGVNKCKFVKSTGRQMQRVECSVCLYWLAVQLIFTELCRVKQFISVIDPRAYTSLSCCQISRSGLKLFLLICLHVSCVFFFLLFSHQLTSRSDEYFIEFSLQTVFPLLRKSRGVWKVRSCFPPSWLNKSCTLRR